MQEPEQGTLVYRSKLDPKMTVVVVWPESDKYEVFQQFFKHFEVSVKEFSNKRFKSRNEKADENIMEYLFFLKRD